MQRREYMQLQSPDPLGSTCIAPNVLSLRVKLSRDGSSVFSAVCFDAALAMRFVMPGSMPSASSSRAFMVRLRACANNMARYAPNVSVFCLPAKLVGHASVFAAYPSRQKQAIGIRVPLLGRLAFVSDCPDKRLCKRAHNAPCWFYWYFFGRLEKHQQICQQVVGTSFYWAGWHRTTKNPPC